MSLMKDNETPGDVDHNVSYLWVQTETYSIGTQIIGKCGYLFGPFQVFSPAYMVQHTARLCEVTSAWTLTLYHKTFIRKLNKMPHKFPK